MEGPPRTVPQKGHTAGGPPVPRLIEKPGGVVAGLKKSTAP